MDTDVAIKSLLEVLNGILIDASELSESAVEAKTAPRSSGRRPSRPIRKPMAAA
jgi:hypothetical protein